MVRLFVVLGFALLVGGAYAIFDGWPYRVLERGFTEVILGGLSVVAGLILLALAAVLAEVRRLKGLVSGAMAAIALSEPGSGQEPLVPNAAPGRSEPAFDKAPEPEAGHTGSTATLVAGAAAAAAAGALSGLAKTTEAPDVKATETADEADKAEEGNGARSDGIETAAEPSQAPSAAAADIDDWLLAAVSPVLDSAPSDVRSEDHGKGQIDEKAGDMQEKPVSPADLGGISQPGDAAADKPAEPAVVAVDEAEAKQVKDEIDDAAKPGEIAPASSAGDRPWWPRIDRPVREEPASVDDEFNALRDQLAGVVNAPEVEPPLRDRDIPGSAESWMAPRPWPPVTQPRDPGALSEVEAEAVDKRLPEEATAKPAPLESEPAAAEPDAEPQHREKEQDVKEPGSTAADVPSAEKAEAPDAEAKLDEEPAASDEGVIGAYQVGETQFTMFADGSIHARTPDGDYTFASMDELKAYLASEKDKLGT